jgi:hypothetical protein
MQSMLRGNTLRSSRITEAAETGYDAIIQEAGALLKDGPLASPHLVRAWNEVTWSKCEDQRVTTDAEVARDGSCRINLYPSLVQKPRKYAAYAILREFGHLIYGKSSDATKRRWMHKLALPSTAQITAVQGKLTPQFKSYHDLVESFTTAMDRYVALNIANALIANGVQYAQSQNIKLKEWGPTQEYCNRRRYHVLIPMVSAYASKDIYEDFGAAFADWVCGMCGITESSVAEATHEILREMIEAMR